MSYAAAWDRHIFASPAWGTLGGTLALRDLGRSFYHHHLISRKCFDKYVEDVGKSNFGLLDILIYRERVVLTGWLVGLFTLCLPSRLF